MLNLRWDTTAVSDFDALVRAIPGESLDSPRRSVVPLVDFFRNPADALAQLGAVIGTELVSPTQLGFEFAVPVQRGRGKASYTDLMVSCSNVTVAIEAKYTEPRYATVGQWLGRSPTANRQDVLRGWISLINTVSACALEMDAVQHLPYQLMHRTASACSPRAVNQALVYLVFGDGPGTHYVQDIAELDGLLGQPPRLSMHVLNVPMIGEPGWEKLAKRWDVGERKLGVAVRHELLAGPLFRFSDLRVLYNRPGLNGRQDR